MTRVIFVRTKDGNIFNGVDGQHDSAGTWVPNPAAKDEFSQIEAAHGVEVLVHIKNGVFHRVYSVNGFHSERRDFTYRQLLDMGILPEGTTPPCRNSVGIRFHLRPFGGGTDLLESIQNYDFKHVQGCKIVEL